MRPMGLVTAIPLTSVNRSSICVIGTSVLTILSPRGIATTRSEPSAARRVARRDSLPIVSVLTTTSVVVAVFRITPSCSRSSGSTTVGGAFTASPESNTQRSSMVTFPSLPTFLAFHCFRMITASSPPGKPTLSPTWSSGLAPRWSSSNSLPSMTSPVSGFFPVATRRVAKMSTPLRP